MIGVIDGDAVHRRITVSMMERSVTITIAQALVQLGLPVLWLHHGQEVVSQGDPEQEGENGQDNLDTCVSDLNILVFKNAACHFGRFRRPVNIGNCLRDELVQGGLIGGEVLGGAPEPVDQPPAVGAGAKAENVIGSNEIACFQVEADKEYTPADPDQVPNKIGEHVLASVLVDSKNSQDDHERVDKVGDDWQPHVAHEVEDLTLQR